MPEWRRRSADTRETRRTSAGIRGLRRAPARSQILLLVSSPRPRSPVGVFLPPRRPVIPKIPRRPCRATLFCFSSSSERRFLLRFIAIIEWEYSFLLLPSFGSRYIDACRENNVTGMYSDDTREFSSLLWIFRLLLSGILMLVISKII